eukprot:RCo030176
MKFPQLPVSIRRLLHPWSRVPPTQASAQIPRVVGKIYEHEKVQEVNTRHPPRVHNPVVVPYERFYERSAGERIQDKWKAKPYHQTFNSKSDENKTLEEADADRQTGGSQGLRFRDIEHKYKDKFPKHGFPLLDYDYPLPAGRLIMKWLYDRQRELFCFQRGIVSFGSNPILMAESWRAPSSILIGSVLVGQQSSVLDGCILRGDLNKIIIGGESNIMENCVLTTSPPTIEGYHGAGAVTIGRSVTIGPNCKLHACDIEDFVSIGSGCSIRYGAKIGKFSIIAAGSVVEEDQLIPPFEIWGGAPARFIRATGNSDNMQNCAESEELCRLRATYELDETVYGNVWKEADDVIEATGGAVRDKIKGKVDPGLPPSLMMYLLDGLDPEEHPNPPKTVAQNMRDSIPDEFANNRVSELRPVWTGNYSSPGMAEARS